METLRKQHKAVIVGTFAIMAVWYYYFYYHYHWGERPSFELFAALGATVPGLAFLPTLFYEKIGWRIFNPELDFDDWWAFLETQNAFDHAKGEFTPSYEAWGRMRIKQSVESIAVVEGQTFTGVNDSQTPLCTWMSKACDLSESGEVVAALEHQPTPKAKGGNVKYGIEVFHVTARASAFLAKGRGRPIRMSSIVYHCIEKGSPAHQVEVNYVRLPKKLQGEPISPKKIRRLLASHL